MKKIVARGIIRDVETFYEDKLKYPKMEYSVFKIEQIYEADEKDSYVLFHEPIPSVVKLDLVGRCVDIFQEINGFWILKRIKQEMRMASKFNPDEDYVYFVDKPYSSAMKEREHWKKRKERV